MSEEITLYSKLNDPMKAVETMGTFIAKSGMFGCSKIEQGQVIALVCMTENMSLVGFHRTYDVLSDGKIRKKAGAALAEFRNRGGKHKWVKTGDDGKEAVLELTDRDGNSLQARFTIEDAAKAGYVKPNSAWVKTPGSMLRARCESNGVAMIAPEIYCGDETEAIAPEINLAAPVEKNATPGFKPSVVTAPVAEPVAEQSETVEPVAEAEVVIEPPKPRPVPAGELPMETVKKLIAAIGEDLLDDAMIYMTTKLVPPWLQDGQTFGNLSVTRANMILNGAERFKKAVRDSKK